MVLASNWIERKQNYTHVSVRESTTKPTHLQVAELSIKVILTRGSITDPLHESLVDTKSISGSTHKYSIYSLVSLGLVLTDINVRAPRYVPVPC